MDVDNGNTFINYVRKLKTISGFHAEAIKVAPDALLNVRQGRSDNYVIHASGVHKANPSAVRQFTQDTLELKQHVIQKGNT